MQSLASTTAGRVEGRVENGIHVFRGIPFAEPPVGSLRFKAPQPRQPWTGVLDATRFGPWAHQDLSAIARQWWPSLPQPGMGQGLDGEASEDCLTLNVWTPALDGRKRPVMVWIHGGAFVAGASSRPTTEGAILARCGDVVVVTVNYRLGALGFLELDEIGGDDYALSGNAGLLDQILALEWVRDNAAAFGGDPGNVTLFGESAGAISVSVLLALPRARRLFHRVIAQSGAASIVRRLDRSRERARELMELAGARSVADLERLPAPDLVRLQPKLLPRGAEQVFGPVMDDRVVPTSPMAAIAAGEGDDIPLLAGTNLDEYRYWLMVDPRLPTLRPQHLYRRLREVTGAAPEPIVEAYRRSRPQLDDNQIAITLLGDIAFRLPTLRMAEARAGRGAHNWMYLFTRPSPVQGGRLGAAHAMDIPFVFGTIDAPGVDQLIGAGPDRAALSRAMQDAWIAFAKTGDPSHAEVPVWPRWDAERQATMIFDSPCRVERDPYREERMAWGGASFAVHA
jgi:para-nitrobenzyl esterase